MPWYENVLLLNAIKGIFAMTVFLLIAYILIRPIAYKLLGIPLPHEQKAAEAAAKAAAAEQLASQPVVGPDGALLPPVCIHIQGLSFHQRDFTQKHPFFFPI